MVCKKDNNCCPNGAYVLVAEVGTKHVKYALDHFKCVSTISKIGRQKTGEVTEGISEKMTLKLRHE